MAGANTLRYWLVHFYLPGCNLNGLIVVTSVICSAAAKRGGLEQAARGWRTARPHEPLSAQHRGLSYVTLHRGHVGLSDVRRRRRGRKGAAGIALGQPLQQV